MFEICKEIYDEQHQIMHVSKMGAMDIGCGYHSYLFAIARCQKQVSILTIATLLVEVKRKLKLLFKGVILVSFGITWPYPF